MSGDLIAQAAYARRVGISPQLLGHHIKIGNVPVHGMHRKVSISEADDALRDILSVGAIAKFPAPETAPSMASKPDAADPEIKTLTLHEARAERARQDAVRARLAREKEEIELALLKGEVVRVADVELEWAAILAALRSRLLAIPSASAARVAAISDLAAVKSFLDDAIRLALDDLSSGRIEPGPTSGRDEAGVQKRAGAAAKAPPERVGGRSRSSVAGD